MLKRELISIWIPDGVWFRFGKLMSGQREFERLSWFLRLLVSLDSMSRHRSYLNCSSNGDFLCSKFCKSPRFSFFHRAVTFREDESSDTCHHSWVIAVSIFFTVQRCWRELFRKIKTVVWRGPPLEWLQDLMRRLFQYGLEGQTF
jgi:hypothetical protein